MREGGLFLLCLAPFLRLAWLGAHAGLGVNPVEFVTHETGDWALIFFCLTLAIRPANKLAGWSWWARQRRMIGLFVFFYATLHFLTFLSLDLEFDFSSLGVEIRRRPYICVGFACWTILAALSATSTDWAIRAMKRWWGRLHTLVYPAAVLGAVHYYMLVKSDTRVPLRYAGVIGILLGYRLVDYLRRLRAQGAPA